MDKITDGMELILEKNYAKENGYHRLGKSVIPVNVPLTDDEKITFGEKQTESLLKIESLQAELARIKKNFKDDIEIHSEVVKGMSVLIDQGYKVVDKELPCFLDNARGQKHWIDLATGEIVKSANIDEQDRQESIFQ